MIFFFPLVLNRYTLLGSLKINELVITFYLFCYVLGIV